MKNNMTQFKYIQIDETEYWNEDFVKTWGEGAKIVATYIYDSECRTFCCELTPSYEMRYAGFELFSQHLELEDFEKIEEQIRENDVDSSDHYRHCHSVKGRDVPCDAESIEDVIEYFHGNPGAFYN
jgi:hypothetical protein